MERLLEEASFMASENTERSITIDAEYVDRQLAALVKDQDLSRYIL
jgi:ATP-dependent HslUV protease ATP-binding subunit HslU